MEEMEVFELTHEKRVTARANLLWTYLNLHSDRARFTTQKELCEVLALGTDGRALRESVKNLEDRGLLRVDRSTKPHRYELIEEKETAE